MCSVEGGWGSVLFLVRACLESWLSCEGSMVDCRRASGLDQTDMAECSDRAAEPREEGRFMTDLSLHVGGWDAVLQE